MKRLFNILMLAIAVVSLAACENDAPSEKLGIDFTPECNMAPTFEYMGGSKEYNFKTKYDWTVRADNDWVTITPNSGGEFNRYFVIEVAENPEGEVRTTNVTMELSNGKSIVIPVTQELAPRFDIVGDSDKLYTIGADGGDIAVDAETNQQYTVKISKDATWLSHDATRAMRDETLHFAAQKNTTSMSRIATVTIVTEENHAIDSFTVVQSAEGVAMNEIAYYTSSSELVAIAEDCDFGAKLVAHLYDGDNKHGRIIFDYTVYTIPAELFADRSDITKIEYSQYITTIGNGAFRGCTGCEAFFIPAAINTLGSAIFEGCAGELTINGMTPNTSFLTSDEEHWLYGSEFSEVKVNANLGANTFNEYEAVESVTLSTEISSIGSNAFSGCGNLTAVNAESLAAWCGIAFKNKSANPLYNGVCDLIIDGEAITEVITDSSIRTIRSYSFAGYKDITSVTIAEGTTSLGAGAFSECDIESVNLNGGITAMGVDVVSAGENTYKYIGVFEGCRVATLTINGDLKGQEGTGDAGYHWFNGIDVEKVVFSDKCTKINNLVMSNVNLKEVSIADSVTEICDGAFASCHDLATIDLGAGVTTIGVHAFYDCTAITAITLPESLTTISEYAFSDCTALTSIALPAAVSTIGEYALSGCDALTTVYAKATKPATLGGEYVFDIDNTPAIYVPEASVDAYKAAWTRYASSIKGYAFN